MSLKDRLASFQNERRYLDVTIEGVSMRFRSLWASERLAIEEHRGKAASILGLMLTLCNEEGQLEFAIRLEAGKEGGNALKYSEADYQYLAGLDGRLFDGMVTAMNNHCVSQQSFEQLVAAAKKNSSDLLTDCDATSSPCTSAETLTNTPEAESSAA